MNIKTFKKLESKKIRKMIDHVDEVMLCYDSILVNSKNIGAIQKTLEHRLFVSQMSHKKKLLKCLEEREFGKVSLLPVPEIISE